jgi:hypothetical protein
MCEACDKYSAEDYDKMLLSMQKQAAELRALLDHKKNRDCFPVHLGWGILYSDREIDKYEICPCDSEAGLKFKWCCLERTKAFRRFLKDGKNNLFFYDDPKG